MKILITIFKILIATLISLAVLEGGCRFLGFPRGAVRFIETVVLKEHLSTHKPKGELRVFTYGESSMHGSHYYPISNPARWLEAYLKDFLPGKNIRVVNFARMGQHSGFYYESFRDTLAYKPDLVIFYMGHNDFLPGNRIDQEAQQLNSTRQFWRGLIRRSRLLSAAVRFGISLRLKRAKHDEEDRIGSKFIESQPADIGPENSISTKNPVYQDNLKRFSRNVERIAGLARRRRIPLIFFRPASNLKDFPPSCSAHQGVLSAEESKNWEGLFEAGKKAQASGDLTGALGFFENAVSLDPGYADLNFRIAQIYLNQGELTKAKAMFERSRDNDCIPTRATSDTLAVFDRIDERREAVVLNAEKIVSAEVPGGILGDPIIEDNVHFSIKGHALLGRALAQEIADRDWLAPKSEWQFKQERPFELIGKSLGVTPALRVYAFLQCANYFGRKYDSRILMAKKAVDLDPENPAALRQLAWSYWLKGDLPHAQEIYLNLKKTNPEALKEALTARPELKSKLAL